MKESNSDREIMKRKEWVGRMVEKVGNNREWEGIESMFFEYNLLDFSAV